MAAPKFRPSKTKARGRPRCPRDLRRRLGLAVDSVSAADDARRLFDGMPPGKKDEGAPPVSGDDRISALPDDVLSFLPVQCRRPCGRACSPGGGATSGGRSTTSLRIAGLGGDFKRLSKFVDHLLILRERTHLDTVEIIRHGLYPHDYDDVDHYAHPCPLSTYIGLKFIFIRDLKHCPTFTKLKTLLLNEYWCEAPNMDPLACILKNSPVLEKLTLQLFSEGPNHKVEMEGSCSPMEEPSAISKHLNMVEIKCSVVDETIHKVLKFLSAFNIRFDLGENIWAVHP